MRKALLTLVALVAAAVLPGLGAGCNSTPKADPRPHWVDNPGDVGRGLAAVGVAPKVRSDARDKATAEARGALARAVQTQIKSVVEVYNSSTQDRDVSETATATYAFSQVNLANSVVRGTYTDEKNFYALVVITDPGAVMKQAQKAIVQAGGDETLANQTIDEMLMTIESRRREFDARHE